MTLPQVLTESTASAASASLEDQTEIGTMGIAGGGFVSGIITGESQMYARTDVGGAYRYDYDTGNWVQLLDFLGEDDRGLLSVDAFCLDPNDENTIYLLCGCAYFSGARTVIFRSHDGGETFDQIDVTDQIQVHGNGDGRQCGEAIAVDPDNPDILYCGGDVAAGESALIMSTDGGDTWAPVTGYADLGYFSNTINWPTWESHEVKALESSEYNHQNGVASIQISDGKVYVATSLTTKGNIVVADVGSDDFEVLSDDLPTGNYPSRINLDADGNLLITYIGGLAFNGSSGGAYKYNVTTGAVTDISPCENGFGAVYSDPNDANKLVATTCGVWYSQLWYDGAWDDNNTCWGDRFFKSTDGGATWTSMTPGNQIAWGQPLEADYLQDGGRSWIQNKAIHWSGAIVIDPRNSDRVLVTSGNGVFACDNTWDTTPAFYFEADGIEEVVALDMVSVPGGNAYSAIGDYDGFEHLNTVDSVQYQPNIGSTSTIAYCPSNPDVMVRAGENDSTAYYTLDGGDTWVSLPGGTAGAKAAINQIDDDTYRIYFGGTGSISYTDDFGETWQKSSGVAGTMQIQPLVDAENPQYVYAYTAKYNSYWFYDTSKSEPSYDDAHYILMVSSDYGKTFTTQDVARYDQCDAAYRIAYLGEGSFVLGAGWYGAYISTDYGKTLTKLDSVFYCKTIGYGAPEKEGGVNCLYMWGQPEESDPQGVYRSSDGGQTWVAINVNHTYGGTGNGNFLVGDMNTFGLVYMSTVGCGIVYMQSPADGTPTIPTTTTTTTTSKGTTTTTTTARLTTTTTVTTTTGAPTGSTTTKAPTTTGSTTTGEGTSTTTVTSGTYDFDVLYGDVNLDGKVSILDVIYLNKALANAILLNDEQTANANCCQDADGRVNAADATVLLRFIVQLEKTLPVTA
jgi:hypothetical protein